MFCCAAGEYARQRAALVALRWRRRGGARRQRGESSGTRQPINHPIRPSEAINAIVCHLRHTPPPLWSSPSTTPRWGTCRHYIVAISCLLFHNIVAITLLTRPFFAARFHHAVVGATLCFGFICCRYIHSTWYWLLFAAPFVIMALNTGVLSPLLCHYVITIECHLILAFFISHWVTGGRSLFAAPVNTSCCCCRYMPLLRHMNWECLPLLYMAASSLSTYAAAIDIISASRAWRPAMTCWMKGHCHRQR